MVLQGVTIVCIWTNNAKQSTNQLEALIPLESSLKVKKNISSFQGNGLKIYWTFEAISMRLKEWPPS